MQWIKIFYLIFVVHETEKQVFLEFSKVISIWVLPHIRSEMGGGVGQGRDLENAYPTWCRSESSSADIFFIRQPIYTRLNRP